MTDAVIDCGRQDVPAPAYGPGPRPVVVEGAQLTVHDVVAVARRDARVVLSADPATRSRIDRTAKRIQELVITNTPVYGVTTGFGDSVHRTVDPGRAQLLQERLIEFLGNGTGPELPLPTARAVMLIRANSLARGHSGVRVALVEQLIEFLNAGIVPVIPEEGSVGASGDLVPLSYIAAALMGRRDVHFDGAVQPAGTVLAKAGLMPLTLEPKEGLGLVNGTAFMTGIAALACADAQRLARVADVCTAMAVEVLEGITSPFDEFLHDVAKPHPGQVRSARSVRTLLATSHMARRYDDVVTEVRSSGSHPRDASTQIQDKYSLRCAPHFTGVLWDVLTWVKRWVEIEINSTTDNPLIDPDSGEVHSGGNFSGGHIALAMDTLKASVASVADLMDRQLELVVDEKFNRGLGANLVADRSPDDPEYGFNHGFKGMQLACSSLTADALSRGMPLSAFSRSTECHNQDKVSMGATAARQTRDVIEIVERIAAIHLIALCQAADIRGAHRLGGTSAVYARIRNKVTFLDRDRPMDHDIRAVVDMIRDDSLLDDVLLEHHSSWTATEWRVP